LKKTTHIVRVATQKTKNQNIMERVLHNYI
jgi:hypothetical protein